MVRFSKIVNVCKTLHLTRFTGSDYAFDTKQKNPFTNESLELFNAILCANMLLKCKKAVLLGYAFSVSIFTCWSRSGRVCSWCSPKYKIHLKFVCKYENEDLIIVSFTSYYNADPQLKICVKSVHIWNFSNIVFRHLDSIRRFPL